MSSNIISVFERGKFTCYSNGFQFSQIIGQLSALLDALSAGGTLPSLIVGVKIVQVIDGKNSDGQGNEQVWHHRLDTQEDKKCCNNPQFEIGMAFSVHLTDQI